MIALSKMLGKSIVMPAKLMTDGQDPEIYSLFSAITQKNGVYTAHDYARIMTHFVALWQIETVSVKSEEALKAQEFICSLPARYTKLADRLTSRLGKHPERPISWLFGRTVRN